MAPMLEPFNAMFRIEVRYQVTQVYIRKLSEGALSPECIRDNSLIRNFDITKLYQVAVQPPP